MALYAECIGKTVQKDPNEAQDIDFVMDHVGKDQLYIVSEDLEEELDITLTEPKPCSLAQVMEKLMKNVIPKIMPTLA